MEAASEKNRLKRFALGCGFLWSDVWAEDGSVAEGIEPEDRG